MQYSLIIVDMQKEFHASRFNRVQRNIRTEIRKAIKDEAPILFVEYDCYKPTIPSLTKPVKEVSYKKAFHVRKARNDGSQEIDKALRKNKLPRKYLRIMGINTDCCVLETIEGLDGIFQKNYRIEVVADACDSEFSHEEGLSDLRKISSNVVIV
jgi:nicotinamidase-related amidase